MSFAPEVAAPTPPPLIPAPVPADNFVDIDSEDEHEAEAEVVIPSLKYLKEKKFVLLEDVIKAGVDENKFLNSLRAVTFNFIVQWVLQIRELQIGEFSLI